MEDGQHKDTCYNKIGLCSKYVTHPRFNTTHNYKQDLSGEEKENILFNSYNFCSSTPIMKLD